MFGQNLIHPLTQSLIAVNWHHDLIITRHTSQARCSTSDLRPELRPESVRLIFQSAVLLVLNENYEHLPLAYGVEQLCKEDVGVKYAMTHFMWERESISFGPTVINELVDPDLPQLAGGESVDMVNWCMPSVGTISISS